MKLKLSVKKKILTNKVILITSEITYFVILLSK